MIRCPHIVCIALLAGTPACLTEQDELELGTTESESKWSELSQSGKVSKPPPTDGGGGGGGGSTTGTSGFIDACSLPGMTRATFNATGTIDANDEGVTVALTLPFSFTLYGTAHTKFWITTNGQLGFGSTVGGSAFGQVTCPIPASGLTRPIVLVYSADLIGRLDANAGICYATTGTAPNRKLVVTWKDSFFYEAWLTSNVTFSAALNEGKNTVDVAIDRVDAPDLPEFEKGYGAALGKQSGNSGHNFSCYQPNAPEGTKIQYNP